MKRPNLKIAMDDDSDSLSDDDDERETEHKEVPVPAKDNFVAEEIEKEVMD